MKKFITIALAAVIAISANAKKVNTAVFNSVKVNAPVHLVIVPSREYSINVTSQESGLTSAIAWTIKDGVLHISARDLEALPDRTGHAAGVKRQAQNPIVQTPPPLTDSKTLSIQHNTKKEEGIPYTGVSSSIFLLCWCGGRFH